MWGRRGARGMGWRRGQAAIGTEWRVGAEQALVEKTNLPPPQLCQSPYLGLPWVVAEGPAWSRALVTEALPSSLC